jgi:hypothetical protein
MIGTLTLSNLNSMHTATHLIILYKSYSVATVEPLEPLLLNNYIRVAALAPDLRAASFYNAREFFYYSSIINLLLLLILMKGSYPIFYSLLPSWKSSSAL